MQDFGELINDTTVRFERLLPTGIDDAWACLVESDRRAKWLCAGDTELRKGGRVDMHFHNASLSSLPDIVAPEKYRDLPEKMSFSGTVIECVPPTVLEHSWDFEDDHSRVRFELAEHDGQTRLVITHKQLSSAEEITSVCGGWHTHLEILTAFLDGREPPPFWKTHAPLEDAYCERLGL